MEPFCVLRRRKREKKRPCFTVSIGYDIRQNIVRVDIFFGTKAAHRKNKIDFDRIGLSLT